MKKYLLISPLIILGFLVLTPVHVSATSGACSYHSGVNCGVENYDGKVVCNDGWINSSVAYYDTDECKVQPPQCSYPVQPSCNLSAIEQQRQNSLGSQTAMNARSGLLGSDFGNATVSNINSEYDLEYSTCQSQLTAFQSEMSQYNNCLSTPTQKVIILPAPPTPVAIPTCQLNSHVVSANPTKCQCDDGYQFNSDYLTYPLQDPCIKIPPLAVSSIPTSTPEGLSSASKITPVVAPIVVPKPIAPPVHATRVASTTVGGAIPFVYKPGVTIPAPHTQSEPLVSSTTTPTTPHDSFISNVFKSIGAWFGRFF